MEYPVNSPEYWNHRYMHGHTGWDLGQVSPPMKNIIDQLPAKDLRILIPGAGNAYEAKYLADNGFTNIAVVDISDVLVNMLKEKFAPYPSIRFFNADFFDFFGTFDVILEQTFFCALIPSLRVDYVFKMHDLLHDNGILSGVLFDRQFEGGPPFGGNVEEYITLLKKKFSIERMEPCLNSIPARQGTEVVFRCRKTD